MPKDKIQLKGLAFYGYHGNAVEEQKLGQRFIVDIEVEKDLRPAGLSDNLEDTINYSNFYRAAKEVVEGPPLKLIETVAERIAQAILRDFDVESVRVRMIKPEVPIKGSILTHAAVEIYREKG